MKKIKQILVNKLIFKLLHIYPNCAYYHVVWCILHFGENMNQFEMEKLMRANMDICICGKICTKKAGNDTNSSFKCHGNILFYTSTRNRNT